MLNVDKLGTPEGTTTRPEAWPISRRMALDAWPMSSISPELFFLRNRKCYSGRSWAKTFDPKVLEIKLFCADCFTSVVPNIAFMACQSPRVFPSNGISGFTPQSRCKPSKKFRKPDLHSSKIRTAFSSLQVHGLSRGNRDSVRSRAELLSK